MAQLHGRVHDLQPRLAREGLRLLVHHHEAGLATGPSARDELECLGIAQEVVAHISHRIEINAVPPAGHEHARVVGFERVKVRQVEEVSYPAVDSQQVERGRRDEVQRYRVGMKERAYIRDSVQHATRLGPAGVHVHANRADVVGCGRRRGRDVTVSVTPVSSHVSMPSIVPCLWPLYTYPWPCGIVECPNAGPTNSDAKISPASVINWRGSG